MSRSNKTMKSPVTRYIKWKGAEGKLAYYDKEQGKDIEIPFPFTFLVLDELNTVAGFHKQSNSGFRSNEVRDMREQPFYVRNKQGIVAKGLYEQIKDEIKAKGAKYAKSIYIAFKDDTNELVIGNLQVSGAALTSWIDFGKKFNPEEVAVVITGATEEKNGATTYFTPDFAGQEVSEATDKAAIALDHELQVYIGGRLDKAPADDFATSHDDDDEDDIVDTGDEEPIDTNVAPEKPRTPPAEPEEKKINLSEVPF